MSCNIKTLSLELVQEKVQETSLYEREHYNYPSYRKTSVYKILGSLENSNVDELTELFRKIMNLLPFSNWVLLSEKTRPTSYFEIIKSNKSDTYYYVQNEYTLDLPWQIVGRYQDYWI